MSKEKKLLNWNPIIMESWPFLFTINSSLAHLCCVVSMLGMTPSMKTPLAGVLPGQSQPFMAVPLYGIMTQLSGWQPPVLLDPFTDCSPSGNVYAVGWKTAPVHHSVERYKTLFFCSLCDCTPFVGWRSSKKREQHADSGSNIVRNILSSIIFSKKVGGAR